MGSGGPSGGVIGILKNIIVFIINYGYIPLQWYLKKSSEPKTLLDSSDLDISSNELVIITGGAGGLGSAIIRKLLALDGNIVVGVRELEKMESIVQEVRETTSKGTIRILKLDMTSLESVQNFAFQILKMENPIRHVINAAGIQGGPYEQTRDGHERQFQVNYLGHFLLIHLLLPKMNSTATEFRPASILNISSTLQTHGSLDLQNLNSEKWYNASQAFYNSKLYVTACSHFLGIRLKQKGIHVKVNSIHPGFMRTNQWQNYCLGFLRAIWMKSLPPPETGADDVICIGFHPEFKKSTGMFFVNRIVDPNVPSLKWRQLEDLWDASCRLVKVENHFALGPGLNNEVLLDIDDGINPPVIVAKKQLNRESTLSIINVNNLSKSNTIVPPGRASMAVAPLETESSTTGISILS